MAAREDAVIDVRPERPAESAEPTTRGYFVDAAGKVHRNPSVRQLVEVVRSGEGKLWIDVDTTVRHQLALLEKVFNFHPLAIEDTLNPNSRVKIEEYPGYIFMIVRGVAFCRDTEDPYDLDTNNINFFLGTNYLVTVHAELAPSIDAMFDRMERSPDILARGVERVAHSIMDQTVDAFFPILDQIDEFIDGLEERVFRDFDETALHEIFQVKRLVLSLRRHLAPQREVFNVLTNRPSPLLSAETQVYFRDIYDHVLRINESLETYRELLSSTLDSYLSQVSNRLGQVTKALSIAATMSIPFVVVSGMWGMNFDNIPLAHSPHGFWDMLVLQLALGALLVAFLRWRKWL
jgi:magnesium transporter